MIVGVATQALLAMTSEVMRPESVGERGTGRGTFVTRMIDRAPSFATQLIADPSRLFLVDGLGACLSATCLALAGAFLSDTFGLPQQTLVVLAAFAIVPAVFSLTCSRWFPRRPLLRAIVVLNVCYCVLTVVLAVRDRATLTALGAGYFVAEIAVIAYLVRLELLAARGDRET